MLSRKIKINYLIIITIIILSLILISSVNNSILASEAKEKYTLRMYSAGEAGMTFLSMSSIAGIIRNNNPEIWRSTTAIPSAGPYAGFRAIEAGEGEGTYSNPMQMVELWTDIGNFANNPIPKEKKALLGPCLWEHKNVLLARADRDDLQSIWDLEGKKVCPTLPGYLTQEVALLIHDALEINSEWVYVELDAICDSLRDGIIDAAYTSVLSGGGVPGWTTELELRMDAKVIPFSKEDAELAADRIDGIAAGPLKLSEFSTRLSGPEDQFVTVLGSYWVFAPHLPEEAVYEIMVALYENKEEVGEVHPSHKIWAENPVLVQEKYIDKAAQVGIPIHPGFAKWLKEHNIWQEHWIVGEINK